MGTLLPSSTWRWLRGLALPLLGQLDYVPGGTGGLPALTFTYALLPLAFKALAAGLLWRWRHSLELSS